MLYEPGPRILVGFPVPPRSWTPYLADCLPQGLRSQALTLWVASYFDHDDLSTRDLDDGRALVHSSLNMPEPCKICPNRCRRKRFPSIGQESALDGAYFFWLRREVWRRSPENDTTAKLFPRTKIALITGDKSTALSITGFWDMQKTCNTSIRSILFRP